MRERTYIAKSRQLAQTQLTTANATAVYDPPKNIRGAVRVIFVANYGTSADTVSLFQDADGDTASNATVLFPNYSVNANSVGMVEIDIPGIIVDGSAGGSLYAKAANANTFTITVYGEEITS